MHIINNKEEFLVDLKWPYLFPKAGRQSQGELSTKTSSNPTVGQTFQLTGWRGAGWRMIFPDEPAQ